MPRPGASRARFLKEVAIALRPHLGADYLLGEDLGTTSADIVGVYESAGVDPIRMVANHHAARGRAVDLPDGLTLATLMNDEFAGVLAGTGAVESLHTVLEVHERGVASLRAAVQGFGTVGLAAARALVARGLSVVTVADAAGTVHAPEGLDVEGLAAGRAERGLIDRSQVPAKVQRHDRESWLSLPAEVLVPAAVAGAIREDNVHLVTDDARYLVEGANGPVTPHAEQVLLSRGVTVLADVVANAGSAVAFGLLASGESTVASVAEDYLARIRDTTRTCARGGKDMSFRERATNAAQEFLDDRADDHSLPGANGHWCSDA